MALLETLQNLTEEEHVAFRKFLASPFFQAPARNHRPENLLALFEFLLKNEPSGEDESFDKAAVYALLFPEKKFAEATVNALASELHRLLKTFLVLQSEAEESETTSLLALARAYKKRGLEKAFLKTIEQLQTTLEKTPLPERDSEFYLLAHLADYEVLDFKSHRNTKSDDIHLHETLQSLDTFFAYSKFRFSAHLLHQSQMVLTDSTGLLPLPEGTDAAWADIPTLRCFRQAIAVLQADDNAAVATQFADFQSVLSEFQAQVPPERLHALFAIERSICARLYQAGRAELLPTLFGLYQKHLEMGGLYQIGGLHPAVFQNIVRAGLKLGQVDWVGQFLETHPPERIVFCQFPEDVHRFNLASWYFEKKDFPSTLRCLQQRYEDNYYVLDANLLEIKLYYERRNWNLLTNKLNSFKVNLFKKSKQWLPPARHAAISRFVDLMRQLIHDRIQMDRDPAAIERLRQKISEETVTDSDWLLEKLAEI